MEKMPPELPVGWMGKMTVEKKIEKKTFSGLGYIEKSMPTQCHLRPCINFVFILSLPSISQKKVAQLAPELSLLCKMHEGFPCAKIPTNALLKAWVLGIKIQRTFSYSEDGDPRTALILYDSRPMDRIPIRPRTF